MHQVATNLSMMWHVAASTVACIHEFAQTVITKKTNRALCEHSNGSGEVLIKG